MKFANYYFEGSQLNNLGDNLQLLAVDYIYQQMGVDLGEIVQIDTHQLATYNGEYVILPVSLPLVDYVPGGLAKRFSEKIIPVFLGLTLLRDFLYPEEVVYLNRFAPVGCRDERTLHTLRQNGVPSYLNGCITALLPRAAKDRTMLQKVFFVDVPESLKTHIPQNLLERAQWETHLKQGSAKNARQTATEQYEMYKNEAALVVTSLLHCAVPCMAAGIPVVLAKTECSYRFAWLEKLLPIYLADEFNKIDWDPKPAEYEQHKSLLLQSCIDRIESVWAQYHTLYDISSFYENRQCKPYIVDTFESIRKKIDSTWSHNTHQEYAVWGLTQLAEQIVHYINKNYPNAHLVGVYDKFRKESFAGLSSQNPNNIRNNPDTFVFVTAVSAKDEALTLFKNMQKKEGTYEIAGIVI